MRGARFHGLRLADVRLPDSALVGSLGEGVTLALRSFQISHCLIPGTVLAGVDSVLRLAVRAATENRPDGRPARRWHKALSGVLRGPARLRHGRHGTAGAQPRTQHAHLLAAAVKYTMPDLLREAAAVLGARGYDRGPLYGGFQKLARDLPVAGLGHSGTAVCQAVLVPQLPALARTAWFRTAEPSAALFLPGAPLPPLDHRRLTHSGTDDPLTATLIGAAERLAARTGTQPLHAALAALARALVEELRVRAARPCRPPDTVFDPLACALADRYALLLCAAACLGVWEGQADEAASSPTRPGRCSSSAASAADSASPYPRHRRTRNRRSWPALGRCRHGRSLDLYDTPYAADRDGTARRPPPRPAPQRGSGPARTTRRETTMERVTCAAPLHVPRPLARGARGPLPARQRTGLHDVERMAAQRADHPAAAELLGDDWQRYRRTRDAAVRYRFAASRMLIKYTAAAASVPPEYLTWPTGWGGRPTCAASTRSN
ncbi:hypothetical protein SROCM77S_06007 [Streptomyces rochei]